MLSSRVRHQVDSHSVGFLLFGESLVGDAMTKKWLVAPESRMTHSWTFCMLMSTMASSALAAYSYLLEVGYRL